MNYYNIKHLFASIFKQTKYYLKVDSLIVVTV